MTEAEALSLIGSMNVTMFGLLVLVAEYVVPPEDGPQRGYVQRARECLADLQDALAVDELLEDVCGGERCTG